MPSGLTNMSFTLINLQKRHIMYMPKGCPITIPRNEWPDIAKRYNNESIRAIAATYSCGPNLIRSILKNQKITIRSKGTHTKIKRGPNHGSWRGGKFIQNGYIRVWAHPDHPFYKMATKLGHSQNAYFLQHRLVVAESIGRPLSRNETVHHKNGITTDNHIENLELRQGAHGPGQCWCCADCGSKNIIPQPLG